MVPPRQNGKGKMVTHAFFWEYEHANVSLFRWLNIQIAAKVFSLFRRQLMGLNVIRYHVQRHANGYLTILNLMGEGEV